MRTYDLFVVVALTVLTASCGSGSRQLQSLAITPSAAAPASLSSPVQFKAIATFTDGSTAQVAALWTLTRPFCPDGQVCALASTVSTLDIVPTPNWISLSNSGVAQCTGSGPKWNIFATAPVHSNIPISQITMNTKVIMTTAQLTCP